MTHLIHSLGESDQAFRIWSIWLLKFGHVFEAATGRTKTISWSIWKTSVWIDKSPSVQKPYFDRSERRLFEFPGAHPYCWSSVTSELSLFRSIESFKSFLSAEKNWLKKNPYRDPANSSLRSRKFQNSSTNATGLTFIISKGSRSLQNQCIDFK